MTSATGRCTRPPAASCLPGAAEELGRYLDRGGELVSRVIERAATRTGELRAQLRALSPQATLDRGYAIAQLPHGHVLRDAKDAPAGTPLLLTVAVGTLDAVSEGPGDRSRPQEHPAERK